MATIHEAAQFNALAYVVIGVNPGNPGLEDNASGDGWRTFPAWRRDAGQCGNLAGYQIGIRISALACAQGMARGGAGTLGRSSFHFKEELTLPKRQVRTTTIEKSTNNPIISTVIST